MGGLALIKKDWPASLGAFFAGAAIGFAVAQVVARLLYRTADGNTTVVTLGRASLAATIPAGLAGGVTTAGVVAGLAWLLFDTDGQALPLLAVALGCGIVVGVLFACLGSLL